MIRQFIKILYILFLISLYNNSYSQDYWIINKNEEIKLKILNDSIQIQIKNTSDISIFLPVDRIIQQICSVNKSSTGIDFGIDLQVFYERGVFELEELKPQEIKSYKHVLIDCDYNSIYFTYQFYMRFYENKKNKKIFNTDFINDKKWLKNGDWEWGEIMIDLKTKN